MTYKVGISEYLIRELDDHWYCPDHDVTGIKTVRPETERLFDPTGEYPDAIFIPHDFTGCNPDYSALRIGNSTVTTHVRFSGWVEFPGTQSRKDCQCLEPDYRENSWRTSTHSGETTARRVYFSLRDSLSQRLDCPECEIRQSLWEVVQCLNDEHEWSREEIADWLERISETMELDIAFPTPYDVPEEPGEAAMRNSQ